MRHRSAMGSLAAAVASAALLASAAPAAAQAAAPVSTFTGTCSYMGFVDFRDPLGALPESNELTLVASGTCTGQLDGRAVADEPTTWHAEAEGSMSCGQGMLSGPGRMVLNGKSISFTFTETRATTVGNLLFLGQAGGALEGLGSATEDATKAIERCADGDGSLSRVDVVAQLAGTISG